MKMAHFSILELSNIRQTITDETVANKKVFLHRYH